MSEMSSIVGSESESSFDEEENYAYFSEGSQESHHNESYLDDEEESDSDTIDESLIDSDLDDESPSHHLISDTSYRTHVDQSNNSFWNDIVCWASRTTKVIEDIGENIHTFVANPGETENNLESSIPAVRKLSDKEEKRIKTVFDHCANIHDARMNEEQFRLALSLLGQIEKDDRVHEVFLKERVDWIDIETFKRLLSELQEKVEFGDLTANIQEAFDALVSIPYLPSAFLLMISDVVRGHLPRRRPDGRAGPPIHLRA